MSGRGGRRAIRATGFGGRAALRVTVLGGALLGAALPAFLCFAAAPTLAQGAGNRTLYAGTLEELSGLSIEELSNIQVTSISKRPEPLAEAPAAVFVITAEDIRRSGATSVVEALRLAPNLEVAQLNAYNYSVSARGFNSPESANKLLVLVDGRSVYSPLAANVFWESVDVSLTDVERIEVVSGPGGTLWGANAVNGVINIITRHTADTQGALVDITGGNVDRTITARYGGKIGEATTYRVYAGGFDRSDTGTVGFRDLATDAFRGGKGGFRVDTADGDGGWTFQGDLYRNRTDFLNQSLYGGNLLGRWTRRLGEGSSLQLQAYYDRKTRDYAVATDVLTTYDLQAQHNLAVGKSHQMVWGAEYRLWQSQFRSLSPFGFLDPNASLSVGNLFAQDEIALLPGLKLTLGLKVESNSYTGVDYLPNGRLAWHLHTDHLLWAAVSRAVRTPSRIDRELQGFGILAEAPSFRAETLTAYEVGYRGRPADNFTLSLSGFHNVYDDIRTTSPTAGGLPLRLSNGLKGETWGVEGWGTYGLTDWWRLRGGFNWLHKSFRLKPGIADLSNGQALGQDPAYQAQLRSEMNLGSAVEFDLAVRRVGRVAAAAVPSYTAVDAHVGWRATPNLELSLHGLNLFDTRHLEVNDPSTSPPRFIGRSVFARIRAGF